MQQMGTLSHSVSGHGTLRLPLSVDPGAGFRAGPLRNLPSQAYFSRLLRTGDAPSLGVALMMVVRDAFDPSPLSDIALRRQCIAMRDAVLPREAMRQREILDRFARGEAKHLGDALGHMMTLLVVHPQRDALRVFASQLFQRDSLAVVQICRNPLVATMLAGIGLFPKPKSHSAHTLQ